MEPLISSRLPGAADVLHHSRAKHVGLRPTRFEACSERKIKGRSMMSRRLYPLDTGALTRRELDAGRAVGIPYAYIVGGAAAVPGACTIRAGQPPASAPVEASLSPRSSPHRSLRIGISSPSRTECGDASRAAGHAAEPSLHGVVLGTPTIPSRTSKDPATKLAWPATSRGSSRGLAS